MPDLSRRDIDGITDAVGRWQPADRKWWRELLDEAPSEAVLIGLLSSRLNARPCDPLPVPSNA